MQISKKIRYFSDLHTASIIIHKNTADTKMTEMLCDGWDLFIFWPPATEIFFNAIFFQFKYTE